ncbi:MAG TPA: peptidoglycan editing factor PgeF [Lapillicoccus sp.]|nr:peptidoglycan editing factor PgeF [Lapillicoccus sp.]
MFFWTSDVAAAPGRKGVRFAFTSRRADGRGPGVDELDLGGRSADPAARKAVAANRTAVATAFGLPRERLLFLNQCHGSDVVVADGPWNGDAPTADAVVSTRDDLALAALTADCVPVLLADPVAGVVAAVHAGRPGMVSGVVYRAVSAFTGAGATPDDTVAIVGPSVCGRCFEVPEGMRAEAAAVSAASATVSWTGTPAIDVAAGVVDQLTALGIRVTWVPGCTRESPDLFSYRRDGTTRRFAGVVRLLSKTAA